MFFIVPFTSFELERRFNNDAPARADSLEVISTRSRYAAGAAGVLVVTAACRAALLWLSAVAFAVIVLTIC